MALNQFKKTLDLEAYSRFEIDHGGVVTVCTVKQCADDLIQVTLTHEDRSSTDDKLEFNSHEMFMTPRQLEDFGSFLYQQGSSRRIKGSEMFMEDLMLGFKEQAEKQNTMFVSDNDHVDLTRPNLFRDIIDTETIKTKMRGSKDYCRRFYAALCNNGLIKGTYDTSYSWRSTGALVADVLGQGDYLDWYCSGNEGFVDEEVAADLKEIGWAFIEDYYDDPDYAVNTQMNIETGEDDEQK